ncbi:hypothetical protein BKI52_28330 [marine bacterium AO1-C]|nr:hypothetical protein BKI52_28330 [marine bacterium AO1-C]
MHNHIHRWINYIAPLLIGVCLYLMIYIQSNFERMYFSYKSLIVIPLIMYGLWWMGKSAHHWLEQHYSWQANPWKRFSVQFLLFSILGLGIIIPLYVAIKSWLIYKQYEYDSIGWFHLLVIGAITLMAIAIIFTIQLSLHFIQQWINSQLEAEKLKKESLQAQFEGLKHQISPHFLFNSMNILSELVDQDATIAKQYIDKLSEVYRYVLQSRQKELVPFNEELEFAKSYIFLLQKRFGENLQVNINTTNNTNQYIPPLTLQLLIENAVKHNIVSNRKPLKIEIYNANQDQLVVLNNKQKRLNNAQTSTQVGLTNLTKRYEYLANQMPEVIETENEFKVLVPLLEITERISQAI